MSEEEIVTPNEPTVETEVTPADPLMAALSDDESEETEASETKEEVIESPDEPVEANEEEEAEQPESKPEDEQPEGGEAITDPEEARKEEARRRYDEREQARAERQQRVQEKTQEYVNEAEDDTDKRLRAMEVQNYNQIIEHNENTLIGEFERVKASPDLQVFNPESEQFNQKMYDKAMRDYNAGYIQYDENGFMVGLKGSLYKHLTETAELYSGAIKSGQFQQVRAERKMKTSADTKPAAQPKENPKDPIMAELLSED